MPRYSRRMSDLDIHGRIDALVAEEQQLRQLLADGAGTSEDELSRVKAIEVALDQCWDLLRQRQALRDAGRNPDKAQVRSASVVEGYEG